MIKINKLNKADPYTIFKNYYNNAAKNSQPNVEAMCISSFSKKNNEVNSRYVNVKFLENKDFIFFTNYNSPKAIEFEEQKMVASIFFWSKVNVQIRIKGKISKMSKKFNQDYFKTRNVNKNALAISSAQSEPINDYKEVIINYIDVLEKRDLETCPEFWGGYKITPYYFEFWEGKENRLNFRVSFKLNNGKWIKTILQP